MESTRPCPWATARLARQELGVSERTLSRWRTGGLLEACQHWRRKFPSPNSPVLYHLERCQSALEEATARTAALLEPSLTRGSGQGGRCGRAGTRRRACRA